MATNERVSYTVAFTADVEQAKAQLENLKTSLNQLSNIAAQAGKNPLGLTSELQEATSAAAQLKASLEGAINIKTGQLDLGKFSHSLKKGEMSLKQYQTQLRNLGPEGDKAFTQLAQAISMAELPLRRTSHLLTDFAVTMKNTAKWQISSSILHGFMGAMQSAYGYAQDLNKSLNNIRIVTGYNTDRMADFAIEANKAAKALSTTTTEYTDASLIYFQQGITDAKELKERTDITIKMANVTGESAEAVSNYMTAVWNNFDNGSKSLEYYADAMTALGAATASSTEEIAAGLEKFAAIADTVGLSYDYATAALATVTAETRQSADVVGTAFKTMFARIEGLKLGETLEDGTTLNQYSEALSKVGVNIKDASGQLKDMDVILEDMAGVWETLARDEKVALTQKVAGVRQYSQLMALMDNWDVMEQNLSVVSDSAGTVDKQQSIYAESWEAARDRVKAASEEIYSSLLKDDFFIDFLNMFEKIITSFDGLIDKLGGLKGVLLTVGALVTKIFSTQMAEGLKTAAYNLKMMTKTGKQELIDLKKEANKRLISTLDTGDTKGDAQVAAMQRLGKEQLLYIEMAEKMSEEERKILQIRMDQSRQLGEEAIKSAEILANEENKLSLLEKQQAIRKSGITETEKQSGIQYGNQVHISSMIETGVKNIQGAGRSKSAQLKEIQALKTALLDIKKTYNDTDVSFENAFGTKAAGKIDAIIEALDTGDFNIDKLNDSFKDWIATLNIGSDSMEQFQTKMRNTIQANLMDDGVPEAEAYKKADAAASEYVQTLIQVGVAQGEAKKKTDAANKTSKGVIKTMKEVKGAQQGAAEGFVSLANGLMSFGSAFSMLSSWVDTIKDPDMSGWDKLVQTITSLSMAIPMLVSGFKALKTGYTLLNTALTSETTAKSINLAITAAQAKVEGLLNKEKRAGAKEARKRAKIEKKEAKEKALTHTVSRDKDGKLHLDGKFAKKENIDALKLKDKSGKKINTDTLKAGDKVSGTAGAAKSAGTLAVALVGVVVAIAAISATVKYLKKDADAAVEAAKTAQVAADSYESAKAAYEDMQSTINSYNEGVKNIKELTEGTEEFEQAILDANDQAMKLLDTYKDLEYTIDENGLIIIDEESLKEAKEQQKQEMLNRQQASLQARQNANEAQAKADSVELQRKLKTDHEKVDNEDLAKVGGATVAAAGIGAAIGSILPGVGTAIGAGIGAATGLVAGAVGAALENTAEESEQEALDKLADLYAEQGSSIFADEEEFRRVLTEDLKLDDEALINSLVENKDSVEDLIVAVDKNTEAQLQKTRNAVVNEYGEDIKKTGLQENQKEFLTDVLTKDANEKYNTLYASDYEDKGWWNIGKKYSDKEIQEMYAKEMRYDASRTKNNNDNSGTYYDKEGNEVGKISDETARKYLAEQEALKGLGETIDEQAQKVRQLNGIEKQLTDTYGDSVQNYQTYKDELIKQGTALGFSTKQIEDYMSKYGTNVRGARKNTISDNLEDIGYDKNVTQGIVEALSSELTDEELELAVSASAESKSLDDFGRKLEEKLQQSFIDGVQKSLNEINTILEDNEISTEEILGLKNNEEFVAYLKEQGKTMADVTNASYTERQVIINGYYNELKRLENEAMDRAKFNYQKDLEEYQAILDYKLAKERGDNTTTDAIQNQYQDIDFEAYMKMDTSEINSELDRIQQKIDEMSDQQIKVAIEWDGIDKIENSYKKAAEFASTVEDDMEVVGDSYQMTAAAAREWMEVYPELFQNAKITEDGLIQLNKTKVDDYLGGQDAMVDATVDAKIAELKAEKASLLEKKEIIKADLELAKNKAVGEMQLESASAEYLTTLRRQLVQYYIDLGYDEQEAHNQALQSMGLSQEEYTRLVADTSAKQSLDMQTSANEIEESWTTKFNRIFRNISGLFSELRDNLARLRNGEKLEWNFTWEKPVDGDQTATTDISSEGVNSDDYDLDNTSETDPITINEAALNKVTDDIVAQYEQQLAEIDKGVTSIDNQVTYLEALKKQDLSSFGETKIEESEKDKEDKKKKLDEEAERYHELNEQLDDLNRNLDKISKSTDKAFGKSKLALIDKEIAATKDLVSTTEDYVRAAEANRQKDAAKLNAFGAKYDSEGRVTNYEEMYTREIQLYNAAVETGDEDAIEAAEKRYEDFQKILNNYEDSLNQVEEKQEQLENYLDSIDELELSKIEYTIELNVQLNQDDLDYIDYQLKMLGNDAYDDAESLALLEQKAASLQAQGKTYADGIAMLLSQKGLNDAQIAAVQKGNLSAIEGIEFTAEEIQLIQNSIKGMQDSNIGLMELNGQIENVLPASFEKWNEKIDDNLEKFDYYDSVANHFKNIIDIVGKKPLGITSDYLKEMGLVQVANNKNEIQALTSTMEELEKQRAEAQEKLANAKTDKQKEYWQNMLDDIEDREAEIQGKILTSTEETLQKIAEIYTQEIQNSLDEFEKQVAGSFETLEKLQEHYNQQKTLSEQYLADYKKLYELNKLNRQLDAAIDDTASVKNKKILQELQEEINEAMKSGNKLSEYDLEVLKKKYDLKLAEAALDEAKNAKSQVRLVRNQEGAYNYMYTADEEEVDNAIQNYEDKLFELQDLNENYIEEMGAAFIQVQQEMVDALSKIQLQDFESYADYKKAVDETTAYYQSRMNFYSSELQKGLDNNVNLYQNEYQKCAEFNNLKMDSYDTFTTDFSETILGKLQPSYKSITEYQKAVNIAIAGEDGKSGLLGDLLTGYKEWRTLTDGVLNDAGTDMSDFAADVVTALVGDDPGSVAETLGLSSENFDEFRRTLKDHVNHPGDGLNASMESWRNKVWGSVYGDDGIIKSSDDTKNKIDTLAKDASTDFSNLAGSVEAWQIRWNNSIQPAIDITNELLKSYENLVKKLAEDITLPDLEKKVVITTEEKDGTDPQDTLPPSSEDKSENPDSSTRNAPNPTKGIKSILGSAKEAAKQAEPYMVGTTSGGFSTKIEDPPYSFIGESYYVYKDSKSGIRFLFKAADVTKLNNGYITIEQGTNMYLHPDDGDEYAQILKGSMSGNSNTSTSSSEKSHWWDKVRLEAINTGSVGVFDTGGYTGAWGSEGKLAMLHEKEIVLNKEDTSNLLAAVGMIREMSNILELKASQQQALGVHDILYSQLLSGLQTEAKESIVEQQITIQAEFPDATDHLQIKEAFSNLINTASQYANRKEIKKT